MEGPTRIQNIVVVGVAGPLRGTNPRKLMLLDSPLRGTNPRGYGADWFSGRWVTACEHLSRCTYVLTTQHKSTMPAQMHLVDLFLRFRCNFVLGVFAPLENPSLNCDGVASSAVASLNAPDT